MKYIFIIIVVFMILIIVNQSVSKKFTDTFSPIKEGYNAIFSKLNNEIAGPMEYKLETTQYKCNDNGFVAQPGEDCMSITDAGGVPNYPVSLSGSNLKSNFNQNGMAVASNSKTTTYESAPQFYEHQDVQNPNPPGIFNDIYSRKKGCSKPGQLDCAVTNLENAYTIPTYTINDNNIKSPNSILYGGQNPKTLIPPMITRPMYSLDWRDNSMVVPNIINGTSNENLYLSGYLSENDLVNWDDEDRMREVSLNRDKDGDVIEEFVPNPRGNPRDYSDIDPPIIEKYNIDKDNYRQTEYKEKDWSDMVNMANGYNKGQFQTNDFPSNLPQGNCDQNEILKEYNNRLFTQVIQPGTHWKQDVIEQVNSNAGISFQQQFLPRTIKEVKGGILVEDHDPESNPVLPTIYEKVSPDIYNVYDPRFSGYGDQTRNYVDTFTGQPRFVYDDINNVRMPNYITRNKLDTFNFGTQYGIADAHGKSLNDIRGNAESAFLDDSIAHRDDLMVKLMRKANAAEWQRKQAPIRKNLR